MRLIVVIASLTAACSFQPGSVASSDGSVAVGSDSGTRDGRADSGSGSCVDLNGDGICDSQAWTCGTKPADPADPVRLVAGTNVLGGDLGGKGHFLVAVRGATVMLAYYFGIQVPCPGSMPTCAAQLEYGLVAGGRQGCLFDGTVSNNAFYSDYAAHTVTVAVPAAAGVYDLRANIGFNPQCGTTPNWYGSQPPASWTIAHVCVP